MSDGNSSSDILGKKIFFLYPTKAVQEQIIAELVQQEFEVYSSKNHNNFTRAVKKYGDSIIFINIDDGMREPDWQKWIKAKLAELPDLRIGIFSSNTDEEFRRVYIEDIKVQCGFMTLKHDMSSTTGKVLEVLNMYNVKGRRKFLRAIIDPQDNLTLNIPFSGDYIKGVIKDISVVGFSCIFDTDPDLSKNTLVKDIQIKLQTLLLKVEGIAFGSRMANNEKLYVFLFTQRVDPDTKVKIRKFIQHKLQSKMDTEIN